MYAATDGTVIAAGPASGYGQWVKLAHPGGISTVYGHLSGWTVTAARPSRSGSSSLTTAVTKSAAPDRVEVRPENLPVDPIDFYAAHGQAL